MPSAAYAQRRLQGRQRSDSVGVEVTGPLTPETNWRGSLEHTRHSGSQRRNETAIRVGISRLL